MNNWQQKSFSETLDKIKQPKPIKTKSYLKFGEHPVVDQGKLKVAGYTNDKGKVFIDVPCVVFGDHTRIFKFIDFPFVAGADGTKVLKPIDELNTKFFYYQLLTKKIRNRGYNRHYSLLKEENIKYPEYKTQKQIAQILSTLQNKVELVDKQIKLYDELKKSTMEKLFSEGLYGEKQKETEIGLIPKSWRVLKLEKLVMLNLVLSILEIFLIIQMEILL
jgi:type I restriction enzyme S subunit